jgi:hypothetical protein
MVHSQMTFLTLQATELGSFRYFHTAPSKAKDLVESFITEANLPSHAFSDSMVC